MIIILLKTAIAAVFGFCGGLVTSAGYFAVINSIGMINRAASVTRTRDDIMIYEDMIVLGVMSGTFLSLYDGIFELPSAAGIASVLIYGLTAGMFIGLFAVSLAENIKAIPIFVKRINVSSGIGAVVVSIALGKAVGHILYYTCLYR